MQATTGMWVTDECKNSFMEMKWKKVHRYIVFKIDEGSKLVTVDKVGGPGEGYDELAASLPTDDCRYAVFDFDFVTNDNCRKSKIFFIAWSALLASSSCSIPYSSFFYLFFHFELYDLTVLPSLQSIRVTW